MLQKKFIVLHILAAVSILLIAQIVGNLTGHIFLANPIINTILSSLLYIAITIILGVLYTKYVLHLDSKDIGLCLPLPQGKWIITAFLLPLSVIGFYLLFVDGSFVKSDTGDINFLIEGIFPAGIAAGICEEFLFRGLIFTSFARCWNRTVAVFVPSVLFAALHLTGGMRFTDILFLLIAGTAVGIMFSLIAIQSRSIWSGALVHTLWNIAMIGSILIIEAPQYGLSENALYRYELTTEHILLTGGKFGIESALPAVTGYCIVSLVAFLLLRKQEKD